MEESNVEARMTAMEHEFGQLREEWKVVQQTPLIQGRLLSALRETQLEHGRGIHLLKLGQHTIISILDQLIAREN